MPEGTMAGFTGAVWQGKLQQCSPQQLHACHDVTQQAIWTLSPASDLRRGTPPFPAMQLRQTFLSINRHHNPKLATKVDVIYALSQAWCMSESDLDFEMLQRRLSDLNPDELILVCTLPCSALAAVLCCNHMLAGPSRQRSCRL